jgi:hypothetical protein
MISACGVMERKIRIKDAGFHHILNLCGIEK